MCVCVSLCECVWLVCLNTVLSLSIILQATFPYSENLRIPCFHRTPDLGFGMLLWSDRHFSSIWREQLAHGESTECPSTAFYPLCRSKAAVDVEWIEGCFDKEVSSYVYRRRTGLSKVTFLKVGWVKISKFLPRDLTQGELGKIEPTGVPLEVWAGFGIGILVLAPKFPYVVSIPATHTRNSSHSTNSSHSSEGIALHS